MITIPVGTTNRRYLAVMVFITTTTIEVVTLAITRWPVLVLVCKKDLFRFQLKFLDLLTDLVESLLSVLVIAISHLW